jgi:hypothetical protein
VSISVDRFIQIAQRWKACEKTGLTMRRMHRIAAATVLVIAGTAAFGLPPDPCSLISTVTDAEVHVAISNGRTSFREGEIIPLVLSFTSSADKRYWADNRNYDRSGRLDIETYCVEPAARDPLADYFRTGAFMGGGLGNEQQLSEKPFTATAELNEWRQPGPGHYQLYVVSHRVWRPPDPNEPTPYGRIGITLRSNTIEFDVTKADADWQTEHLQEATSAYQNAAAGQEKEAARRLRFLNSKASVQTLARMFWGLNDQPGGWDLMFGLVGSPYRADAIAAMQREINAPGHPITQDFMRILTKLQIDADSSWDPPAYDPAHPSISPDFWNKRRERERDLMQTAVTATAAALPAKTGQARALTVQALTESSDLLNATTAAQMRKQLIAVWSELPETTKLNLIQYQWPMIAGPEMLPILKEFVAGPPPPDRTEPAMARDAALQHLFDLDPAEGQALILQDLRNPRANPSLSLIKLLPADELRPVVQEAVARIRNKEARGLDYHLVELFGDQSALAATESVFRDHLGEWACDPQDAMLRYFLRVAPEVGTKMVEASLAARKTTGCYRMLLQDLGKSLPKVEQLAINALDDEDLEVANDAALALGRWGTAKAELALWARLRRFHEQWKDREGELRPTPDYRSALGRATALESTLVNSIATGTNWICGPEKFERLRALASPHEQMQIAQWNKQWEHDGLILPNWYPKDQLSFGVLQYSNLDEEQFRAKLSQMPQGIRLKFEVWKPGQISPPVSMEKQEAVFQSLRAYAAQFGVAIEEKSEP